MHERVWRKSSYSGSGNGDCVEVAWRKSSYSGGGNGDCVEVAVSPTGVDVRDSKNVTGPILGFPVDRWQRFLATQE